MTAGETKVNRLGLVRSVVRITTAMFTADRIHGRSPRIEDITAEWLTG